MCPGSSPTSPVVRRRSARCARRSCCAASSARPSSGRSSGEGGTPRVIRGLLVVALLTLAWPASAAADLSGVGSEVSVGPNGTGEACKLRVIQDDAGRGTQRLHFYCDGWSVSSGTLFRFRVARETTVDKLLTDSSFQRSYETRLTGCGPVEPTTLADGTAAALRQCTRVDGGWPMVVVSAIGKGRGVALETFPTNVRLLEAALAALAGQTAGGARQG